MTGSLLVDWPGSNNSFEYFAGTDNYLTLSVFWQSTQGLTSLHPDQCQRYFAEIVNGCDGNDPARNSQNLEFGGTCQTLGGLELRFQPNVGKPQKKCYGENTNAFLDGGILAANIAVFCRDNIGRSATGGGWTSVTMLFNRGTQNEVTLNAKWPGGTSTSFEACNSAMNLINSGCDIPSNDGINPDDFKHGGERYVGGVFYTIVPAKNNTITDGSNFGTCDLSKQRLGTTGIHDQPIDKPAMQVCLAANGNAWGEKLCNAAVNFYISGLNSWKSVHDCQDACKNCLSAATRKRKFGV